jgi:hypothetical protein
MKWIFANRSPEIVSDNTKYSLGIRHNFNAGIIAEYLKIYHLRRPHVRTQELPM